MLTDKDPGIQKFIPAIFKSKLSTGIDLKSV